MMLVSASALLLIITLVTICVFSWTVMAAKMAKGGGLYLNNERITDPDRVVTLADMLDESVAIMRVGKKQQYVIKVE